MWRLRSKSAYSSYVVRPLQNRPVVEELDVTLLEFHVERQTRLQRPLFDLIRTRFCLGGIYPKESSMSIKKDYCLCYVHFQVSK